MLWPRRECVFGVEGSLFGAKQSIEPTQVDSKSTGVRNLRDQEEIGRCE